MRKAPMKKLSAVERKYHWEKVSKHIDAAVEALSAAVSEETASENGFGDYESSMLEISNEVCRRVLSKRLKSISQQCENDFFFNKRR
jgi:hypothetical protein